MAERSKAHAWKACMREIVSRVRIPLSPPSTSLCYVILCHNTKVSLDSLDKASPSYFNINHHKSFSIVD